MTYDAFISYSHGADAPVAEALERGLQRFAKPWYRRRALHVFRDTTALSANPGLWSAITESMNESEYLVVCCSPEAAASPWVSREIEHWTTTKSASRIMLALTAGELVWDNARGDFDQAASTALPAALAGAFAEEPLFVDMRWARTDEQLTLRNPRFKDQVADLAAPMHGHAKDVLVGEEMRQHRRTLLVAWSAAALLALLSIATLAGGAVALDQKNTADDRLQQNEELQGTLEERRLALDSINSQLADQTKELDEQQAELEQQQETLDQTEKEVADQTERADASETRAALADERSAELDQEARESQAARAAALADADEANQEADEATNELAAVNDELFNQTENLSVARAAAADAQQTVTVQGELIEKAGNDLKNLQGDVTQAQQELEAKQQEVDDKQQLVDAKEAELAAKQIELNGANENLTTTNALLEVAETDLAVAIEEAKAANADSKATRLAIASSQLRDSQLDLSLLLANAATQVEPDAAALALAATENSTSPTAHSALLSAVQAGTAAQFLQFAEGEAPQALTELAVSPDGQWIAAAEDSNNIKTGDAAARLFVWHAPSGDPTEARAVQLTDAIGCISDLQWTATNTLLTVDNGIAGSAGCLDPAVTDTIVVGEPDDEINGETNDIRFVSTRVLEWVPTGNAPLTFTPQLILGLPDHEFLAYSLFGKSPITMSADHTHIAIQYELDPSDEPLDPVVALFNTTTNTFSAVFGSETAEQWGRDTMSEGGRYVSGYDYDANTPVVWDLDDHSGASHRAIYPANPAVRILDVSPDETTFAAPRTNGTAVEVFSANDGGLLQSVALAPPSAPGYSLGNSRLALAEPGGVRVVAWSAPGQPQVDVTAAPAAGCSFTPNLSPSGGLLFLHQSSAVGDASTVVVSTETGETLGQPRGRVVSADTNDRFVVTETLDFLPDTGRFGLEIWEFNVASDPPSGRLVDARSGLRPEVSADGTVVAGYRPAIVSGNELDVEVWNLPTSDAGVTVPGSVHVRNITFAPGHTFVGVGRMQAGLVWDADATPHEYLWRDTNSGVCDGQPAPDQFDTLIRSALAPNGRTRALSLDAQTITLVDLNGGPTVTLPGLGLTGNERIEFFDFTQDGRSLIVSVETPSAAPGGAKCKNGDVVGARLVQIYAPDGSLLPAPVVSPPFGERIVTSSGDGGRILFTSLDRTSVIVRDATTLEPVAPAFDTGDMATDPNGDFGSLFKLDEHGTRVAATNSTGTAVVWTLANGAFARTLELPAPGGVQPTAQVNTFGADFSPDDTRLAIKTVDQRLIVWNLVVPAPTTQIRQLPNDVAARVSYSPDSTLIAIDGLYLFDGATLQPIGPRLHPAEWAHPAYDQGSAGSDFLTGGNGELYIVRERTGGGSAVRWRVDVAGLQQAACDAAGRGLTEAERSLYDIEGTGPCGG